MSDLRIVEGRFYRTRDGRKVGPLARQDDERWPWRNCGERGPRDEWAEDGRWTSKAEDSNDLVAEWTRDSLEQVEAEMQAEIAAEKRGPVREVTRKEIVPGTYGRVVVRNYGGRVSVGLTDKDGGWSNAYGGLTPDELRAAAATLNEIADALSTEPHNV